MKSFKFNIPKRNLLFVLCGGMVTNNLGHQGILLTIFKKQVQRRFSLWQRFALCRALTQCCRVNITVKAHSAPILYYKFIFVNDSNITKNYFCRSFKYINDTIPTSTGYTTDQKLSVMFGQQHSRPQTIRG